MQQLIEREAQYRALVEHSPDLIARFDRQGQLLYLSPSAARYGDFGASPLMGLRNAETGTPLTLSRRWLEAMPPDRARYV